uniref:Putative secreted peptide n=1 Tax=Anopheles braziliensis TaxID=58242 RepID=A0A2M3ZW70_9DIPT
MLMWFFRRISMRIVVKWSLKLHVSGERIGLSVATAGVLWCTGASLNLSCTSFDNMEDMSEYESHQFTLLNHPFSVFFANFNFIIASNDPSKTKGERERVLVR